MSTTLFLRFSKFDVYQNPVFVASSDSPNTEEHASYEVLKTYFTNLQKKGISTFLPIFQRGPFASIRFKKHYQHTHMVPNNIYEVSFEIRRQTRDGKQYVNCFIQGLKIERKVSIDRGEVLDLSM